MDLCGKHAVITGGSSGIGLTTAQAVVAAGGRVTIIGRTEPRLREAADILGPSASWLSADTTSEESLAEAAAKLDDFDHLVTAAGPMPMDGPVLSVPTANARALFEGKFWGQLFTVRAFASRLRGQGSITLVSGTLSRKPSGGVPIFAAIDGAIESMSRVMAIELAPIRVNVIAPGIVDTPMVRGGGPEMTARNLAAYGERVLTGRAGRPEDIAQAILLLMTNTFITASVLDADGGIYQPFMGGRD